MPALFSTLLSFSAVAAVDFSAIQAVSAQGKAYSGFSGSVVDAGNERAFLKAIAQDYVANLVALVRGWRATDGPDHMLRFYWFRKKWHVRYDADRRHWEDVMETSQGFLSSRGRLPLISDFIELSLVELDFHFYAKTGDDHYKASAKRRYTEAMHRIGEIDKTHHLKLNFDSELTP